MESDIKTFVYRERKDAVAKPETKSTRGMRSYKMIICILAVMAMTFGTLLVTMSSENTQDAQDEYMMAEAGSENETAKTTTTAEAQTADDAKSAEEGTLDLDDVLMLMSNDFLDSTTLTPEDFIPANYTGNSVQAQPEPTAVLTAAGLNLTGSLADANEADTDGAADTAADNTNDTDSTDNSNDSSAAKADDSETDTKSEDTKSSEKTDSSEEADSTETKASGDLTAETNEDFIMDVTDKELEILYRIVEAEAGDQDIYGRILVANVILNRVLSSDFADTIEGVVFEKIGGSYQFAPTKDGRYYTVTVTKKTRQAVKRCLEGEDYSQGALYFFQRSLTSASKSRWFDNALDFLFKYGDHEFFIG